METLPLTMLEIMIFQKGKISVVPQLLWHGTLVYAVSSEEPPHLVASFDQQGMLWIYSDPDMGGYHITLQKCTCIYTAVMKEAESGSMTYTIL
jgi:hypothetical protein